MIDPNPLCCCEYVDLHHERNHILACCCNCQHFDEGFDSFISGRGFPLRNKSGLVSTLQDRLRVPWKGGAKKMSGYTALSIVLIPTFLILATGGRTWTMISACTMLILLFYIRNLLKRNFSTFLFKWLVTSFVVLYVIFQVIVIPFLQILTEENIALTISILISCFCFWKVKTKKVSVFENNEKMCNICQKQVPIHCKHSIWLDCCIGLHNACPYLVGLTTTSAALLYGSNLAFTTVCHPRTLFWTVLIPDDCSDAYDLFELGLSFVGGLYSLEIGVFTVIVLIREVVVTLGQYKYANKQVYNSIFA